MQVQSLGRKDPLEKGMATHSGILAWQIPWTEEPGRIQSIGSQRVNWESTHTHITQHTSIPLWGHDPSVLRAAKASKSSPADLLLPAIQLLIRKRWEIGRKIILACRFRPAHRCSVRHRGLFLETPVSCRRPQQPWGCAWQHQPQCQA